MPDCPHTSGFRSARMAHPSSSHDMVSMAPPTGAAVGTDDAGELVGLQDAGDPAPSSSTANKASAVGVGVHVGTDVTGIMAANAHNACVLNALVSL